MAKKKEKRPLPSWLETSSCSRSRAGDSIYKTLCPRYVKQVSKILKLQNSLFLVCTSLMTHSVKRLQMFWPVTPTESFISLSCSTPQLRLYTYRKLVFQRPVGVLQRFDGCFCFVTVTSFHCRWKSPLRKLSITDIQMAVESNEAITSVLVLVGFFHWLSKMVNNCSAN